MKTLNQILALSTLLLASTAARADMPSTHGMFVFGDKATYLSHLPMFHAPHDYQVILKAAFFSHGHSQAIQKYEAAKAEGKEFFTLAPEKMDLTKVISGEKLEFVGQLFEGHFEKDGAALGLVKVIIEEVVYAKKLDASKPQTEAEQYLVFGKTGETFAAHVIGGKPSFDEILKVSAPYEVFAGFCSNRLCTKPSTFPATVSLPLTFSMDESEGQEKPADVMNALRAGPIFTTVQKVLYLEEGELSH